MDRRTALKTIGGLASGTVLLGVHKVFAADSKSVTSTKAPATTVAPTPALVPAQASNPIVKALKYVDDVATMPADIKTLYDNKVKDKKLATSGFPMKCLNCSLYTGGNNPAGGCQIMKGLEVKASGWCTGWAAKA